MQIFTCDDFNADCPENWEEILSFLNNLCEDYHFNDEDDYPLLWSNFWYELGYNAEKFDIIDHKVLERKLVQETLRYQFESLNNLQKYYDKCRTDREERQKHIRKTRDRIQELYHDAEMIAEYERYYHPRTA